MERLEGTVAVVTGAASGIGAATAERLAAEGATVATIDITDGVDYVLDVRDEAAVRDAFADVVATHGRLDSVVHCAGVAGRWAGPHRSSRVRVGPGDRHQPEGHLPGRQVRLHPHAGAQASGSIVNIASHRGDRGHRGRERLQRLQGWRGHADQVAWPSTTAAGASGSTASARVASTPRCCMDIIDAPGVEIYRDNMRRPSPAQPVRPSRPRSPRPPPSWCPTTPRS